VLFALACAGVGAGVGMLLRDARAGQYDDERRIVEKMTPEQKYALRRNFEEWSAVSTASDPERSREENRQLEAQRQRLRNLQRELLYESEDLKRVMDRYYAWTFTLMPGQPTALSALNVPERVQMVRQIQQEQDKRAPLPEADTPKLEKWLETVLASKLREKIPKEKWDEFEATVDARTRRWRLFAMIVPQRWASKDAWQGILALVTEEDLRDLEKEISPASREKLATRSSLMEKHDLLRNWILSANRRFWGREGGSEVSKEELLKFARDKLSDAEYEALLQLPAMEIERDLRIYHYRDKHPEGPRPWSGPGRRGGPPGGGQGRSGQETRPET
jgi:hypothetical protein